MSERKVVYIIGDNRSGSTLLDYLLSCNSNAISVGELHNLSDFYYRNGRTAEFWKYKCGCGETVDNCAFWLDIINRTHSSKKFFTRVPLIEPQWSFINKNLHKLALKRLLSDAKVKQNSKLVSENCWRIYEEIFSLTNKTLIVDSSKSAFHAFALFQSKRDDIDLYFLVLERDIRSVAFSKLNRLKGRKHYQRRSIWTHLISSFRLRQRNQIISTIIGQSNKAEIVKRVDYLELTKNPVREVGEICAFLGIPNFGLPRTTNNDKGVQHVIGGSPSRYATQNIAPDERWKSYFSSKLLLRIFGKILQSL